MTTRADAGPWPIRHRVELATEAMVALEPEGHEGESLARDLLSDLFSIGLSRPPRDEPRDSGSSLRVNLYGTAKFLVGELDLGQDLGLEVVVRGLEHAIDTALRDSRAHHDPIDAARAATMPLVEAGGDEAANEVVMSLDDVADALPSLLNELSQGLRVVLTDGDERVAVLVSWRWYALQRERLARAAAAYWRGWSSGRFNADTWVEEMASSLAPANTPPAQAGPGGDEVDDEFT